jgi:uncharacterized repeat protein (TIGR03803 family)
MSFAKFTQPAFLLFVMLAIMITRLAQAQTRTETVLYSFTGSPDGGFPIAGLSRDAEGNFYGTTRSGGLSKSNCAFDGNCGIVFKVDRTGHETVLYNFCSATNCTDGYAPYAGLIQDAAGNLYGTTEAGGLSSSNCAAGTCGTVFKLDTTGRETVLYNFCSAANCTDGYNPQASLIQDAAGNLYGTTSLGGNSSSNCQLGCGTVFKLDTTGHETVLYTFCSAANCTDGANPYAGLIQDAAGNLYGTTVSGGNQNPYCSFYGGCGTVFEVDTTGHETVLYTFCSAANCTDGANPYAGLIQDAAGNLYGTTYQGGTNRRYPFTAGSGTVFKVDNMGQETVLHNFCAVSNCADGALPTAPLIRDDAGNLYGTASSGGSFRNDHQFGAGTVFKLDNAGQDTVLYKFCTHVGDLSCADGDTPFAGLIQDAAGDLYGTTLRGGVGAFNNGTVYKLTATLSVTLTSNRNPSYVGQSVTFLAVVSGSGVTPTGSVTFKAGTTVLGTVTLDNGQASLTTTFTKSAKLSIVASYSGDPNYQATNSIPLSQVVKQYTTSTALASSLNPSTHGQAVTFTATVSAAGPAPGGFVTFKNGSTWLGKASLSGNVAKITTSNLPVGTLSITARYDGDSAHATSTSPILQQVVK